MSTSNRPQARRGPSGAWNRLKPVQTDPLDVYGLPSKGEMRLHEHKIQEAYYNKIVERYMKFCASSGGGDGLAAAFDSLSLQPSSGTFSSINNSNLGRPPVFGQPSENEKSNDLPNILLAMRKLREGILGSRRKDNFAQRAYMFIIHASILTRSWESYQPALNYLLYQIHPRTPLSTPALQEFVGYRVLDLACREYELVNAFSVKLEFKYNDRRVSAVLHSLIHDDWVTFWRMKRAVDGYQRAIMDFTVKQMRSHALKCLGRSYMNADKAFIERSCDARWDELVVKSEVGWQLQESGNVIIRKPKVKS